MLLLCKGADDTVQNHLGPFHNTQILCNDCLGLTPRQEVKPSCLEIYRLWELKNASALIQQFPKLTALLKEQKDKWANLKKGKRSLERQKKSPKASLVIVWNSKHSPNPNFVLQKTRVPRTVKHRVTVTDPNLFQADPNGETSFKIFLSLSLL